MNKAIITVCILLLLALFPMPYGYYTLLRLSVCGLSAYLFYNRYEKEKFSYKNIGLLILALVYNPIIRVSFDKDIWGIINIISIIYFLYIAFYKKDEE